MTRIVVVLACLLGLALLPSAAQASELRVTVLVHGPGTIGGHLPCVSTAGNDATKVCGLYATGYSDESSSSVATLSATASAFQPNKSAFVKWTCTTGSNANCGSCNSAAPSCNVFSALEKGVNNVIVTATFSDTTAPNAPTVTPNFSTTVDRQVSFGVGANDTIESTLCSLDGAAFTACAAPRSYVLAEGQHTFQAKAVDPSDNISAASALTTFRVIDTVLVSGPAGASSDTTPAFTYSTLTGMTFECSLDNAPYAACGSKAADGTGSIEVGALADGPHTFRVRAKDGAAFDRVPATRAWTVDTTAPAATLDPFSGPGQGALQAVDAETFAFSLDEAGSAECSLDGAPFAACVSPVAVSGLAPGAHAFSVRATDLAGNRGAAVTRGWAVAARDGDGDGADTRADCDDAVAAVHPGAAEIPGNGIDENCDGADPTVVGAPPAVLKFTLSASGKGTKLKRLRVTGVPKGATVTVVCTGKGCPKRRYVKRNASGTVDLAAFRRLPTTATLMVTVSKPGAAPAVRILKTRTAKAPRISSGR